MSAQGCCISRKIFGDGRGKVFSRCFTEEDKIKYGYVRERNKKKGIRKEIVRKFVFLKYRQ